MRKEKDQRVAEAKEIRKERRRLYRQQSKEYQKLDGTSDSSLQARPTISSEEYLSSQSALVQQTKYNIIQNQSPKRGTARSKVIIVEHKRDGARTPAAYYDNVKVLSRSGHSKLLKAPTETKKLEDDLQKTKEIQKEEGDLEKEIEESTKRLKTL